jgi:hypothetical protein
LKKDVPWFIGTMTVQKTLATAARDNSGKFVYCLTEFDDLWIEVVIGHILGSHLMSAAAMTLSSSSSVIGF